MWVRCLGVNQRPALINLSKVFHIGLFGSGDQWAVAAHYSEEASSAALDVATQMMLQRAKKQEMVVPSSILLTAYLTLAEATAIHTAIGAAMAKGTRVLDLTSR